MFDDMQKAMQDCDEAMTCRQQLEEILTKACSELPDLQIQAEATP